MVDAALLRLDTKAGYRLMGFAVTSPDPDYAVDAKRLDLSEVRSHPRERAQIESLKKMVPRDVASVLDVGARDGYLSLILADEVERVVAFDLIPFSVDHARVFMVTRDA